jgi:hypothetical protein
MLHSTKICAHKLPFRPTPLGTVSCCRMTSLGLSAFPVFPWTNMLSIRGSAPRVWLAAEAPSCLEPTSPCESLASPLMAAAPPLSPALPLRAMAGAEPWWLLTLFCSAVCACSVAGELAVHALDAFMQSDRPDGPDNAKAVIEKTYCHMVLLQPQLAVHVKQNKAKIKRLSSCLISQSVGWRQISGSLACLVSPHCTLLHTMQAAAVALPTVELMLQALACHVHIINIQPCDSATLTAISSSNSLQTATQNAFVIAAISHLVSSIAFFPRARVGRIRQVVCGAIIHECVQLPQRLLAQVIYIDLHLLILWQGSSASV